MENHFAQKPDKPTTMTWKNKNKTKNKQTLQMENHSKKIAPKENSSAK